MQTLEPYVYWPMEPPFNARKGSVAGQSYLNRVDPERPDHHALRTHCARRKKQRNSTQKRHGDKPKITTFPQEQTE